MIHLQGAALVAVHDYIVLCSLVAAVPNQAYPNTAKGYKLSHKWDQEIECLMPFVEFEDRL
jgi:hypothetical protein